MSKIQQPAYVDILSEDQTSPEYDKPPPYESLQSTLTHQYVSAVSDEDPAYSYVGPQQVLQMRQTQHVIHQRQPQQRREGHVRQHRPLPPSPEYETLPQSSTESHIYDQMRQSQGYAYSGPDAVEHDTNVDEYEHSYEYPQVTTLPQTASTTVAEGQQLPMHVPVISLAPQPVTIAMNKKPKTWLPWSVITLIFFCLPLGIPAVILSVLIKNDWENGRYEAARRKSTAAMVINIVATVFGGIIILVVIGGVVIVVGVCGACARRL